MDPNVTLEAIERVAVDNGDTGELVEALADWLRRGGVEPDWTRFPNGTKHYRRAVERRLHYSN